MNTNKLKTFAQEVRRKLLKEVETRLDYVLTHDSVELREQGKEISALKKALQSSTKEQLIEKVAYTWFNRFMALRFMDVNEYQPLNIRVLSPKEGFTVPELLEEAKNGNIPEEIIVDRSKVNDLLDGKIPSNFPQNEVYRILLISYCDYLNPLFPFLFERLNDYTKLLIPSDLITETSVLNDFRDAMDVESCSEVEVIGWLYQFYISEKKDEVFASKSKVKKEDIPSATQLFTPRWIVEYMTQNSVGKLWKKSKPSSTITKDMKYYIESESEKDKDGYKLTSPEEITLIDPASGSGHILVYGFELLTKIYEEEGYSTKEIPQLIFSKNLFGIDIDERATQLASFALMMKAREYHKRFFRNPTIPNVVALSDYSLSEDEQSSLCSVARINLSENFQEDLELMKQATNLGSLITPKSSRDEIEDALEKLVEASELESDIIYSQYVVVLKKALRDLLLLSRKFTSCIANPPYMGGGNMNSELAKYVKKKYPDSKSDLMATFMERSLTLSVDEGFVGMINQHSWMFLSSYEKLREKLIDSVFFDTLLHLGARTFPEIGGEVVQNSAFTFYNKTLEAKGEYLRLVDFGNTFLKSEKVVEAIQNPQCGWFFQADQKDFEKIPNSPIAYWISQGSIKTFNSPPLGSIYETKKGLVTMNDKAFVREWFEVPNHSIGKNKKDSTSFVQHAHKWVPYKAGGGFKKWYGLQDKVLLWEDDGLKLKSYITEKSGDHYSRQIFNERFYFNESISWNSISTSKSSFRFYEQGFVFGSAGPSLFLKETSSEDLTYLLGLLNSKLSDYYFDIFNPTVNLGPTVIRNLPFLIGKEKKVIETIVEQILMIYKSEQKLLELSSLYKGNSLVFDKVNEIEEAINLLSERWSNKFFQLHQNEEKLNAIFIDIYGLQQELNPTVSLKDITILQQELDRDALEEMNSQLVRKEGSWEVQNYQNLNLPFDKKEVIAQFISYAVGVMFGRYSLDKEGLILANAEETLEDYLKQVNEPTFKPDDDNIIPVLDADWFEDDIVGCFREFLKVTFGEQSLDKNISFIEDALGKDLRKYFTKEFYKDHTKRYKKRPIYWMFSSPKGAFRVLIYMHRYNKDTANTVLNGYLRDYQEKLKSHKKFLQDLVNSEKGTKAELSKANQDIKQIEKDQLEIEAYERDVLLPLANERISINLDNGVLVNYNKFGSALESVSSLNDAKAQKKVASFDWVEE